MRSGSPTSLPLTGLPLLRTLNLPFFTLTYHVQLVGRDLAEVLGAEVDRRAGEAGAVVAADVLRMPSTKPWRVGFFPAFWSPMMARSQAM